MMRSLGLSLVAFASLVACTETGAHLTLSAPNGPTNAKTFRVVLASPVQIPTIRDQRLAPGAPSTSSVSYFLQRTVASGDPNEAIDDVDGFAMRIAPDTSLAETSFIPFVLMYDDEGAIEGIGTYRAGKAPPSAIRVATDVIDKYIVNVERTQQLADDSLELQPGEVRVIMCGEGAEAYTSGVAWHTLAGEQYRLLFPNDGSLDATGRDLDMDCDGREVTAESSFRDCDDTRARYHRDVTDVCDGEDTNCDGARVTATECTAADLGCIDPFGASGLQLCSDTTGHQQDCQPAATCGCASGDCRYCTVPYEGSRATPNSQNIVHPCQPATGELRTDRCTDTSPCDVEVIGARNGWKAKISATATGAFGSRASAVGEWLAIKVERIAGVDEEIPGGPYQPVGDVHLAFITETEISYLGLGLKLDANASPECAIAPATPMLTCY